MADGKVDKKAVNIKALKLTIKRDRKLRNNPEFTARTAYLDVLDDYVSRIREELHSVNELPLNAPTLLAKYKDETRNPDGSKVITCRPLAVFTALHDKIILAVTSRYLASKFNWYLHKNILSYRTARKFYDDERFYVTDFNDGIALIKEFRNTHEGKIYAADCDIKKFYDTINHGIVRDCFMRMLDAADLCDEGKRQVMRVMDAYLKSYNFYDNTLQASKQDGFWNSIAKKCHDTNHQNTYKFGWVDDNEFAKCYGSKETFYSERKNIGVPQGGSLSLLIADMVLNDVDQVIVGTHDKPNEDQNLLLVRFCDDMILMHTDKSECERLMCEYCNSLSKHKLVYHKFTQVADVKDSHKTKPEFWNVKSHATFCWCKGEGDESEWIGFLGYEMRNDGMLRLRKSNISKVEEKLWRKYYGTLRAIKNTAMTQAEAIKHIDESYKELPNVLGFYKELEGNPILFMQLKHLNQKRKRLIRRLSNKQVKSTRQKAQFIRKYLADEYDITVAKTDKNGNTDISAFRNDNNQ